MLFVVISTEMYCIMVLFLVRINYKKGSDECKMGVQIRCYLGTDLSMVIRIYTINCGVHTESI